MRSLLSQRANGYQPLAECVAPPTRGAEGFPTPLAPLPTRGVLFALAVPFRESGERSEPKGFLKPLSHSLAFVTAPLQGSQVFSHPLSPPPVEGVYPWLFLICHFDRSECNERSGEISPYDNAVPLRSTRNDIWKIR